MESVIQDAGSRLGNVYRLLRASADFLKHTKQIGLTMKSQHYVSRIQSRHPYLKAIGD